MQPILIATRCEMALVLSDEEAQALGFHSLGGSPEVP
jgi:hypothetical protein